MMKKALPGKHGDSINYTMLVDIMVTFGIGIVLGIILIGYVF